MAPQPGKAPTMGDLVVGAGARCAYDILTDKTLNIQGNVQNFIHDLVHEAVALAQQNLPSQSLIEKAVGSPLNKLLSNIETPTATAINAWVQGKYMWAIGACDIRAKMTNQ